MLAVFSLLSRVSYSMSVLLFRISLQTWYIDFGVVYVAGKVIQISKYVILIQQLRVK